MQIFKNIDQPTHEKVKYFYDSDTNLKAFIAVHSTALGPSLGGCRMKQYNTEKEALFDIIDSYIYKLIHLFRDLSFCIYF